MKNDRLKWFAAGIGFYIFAPVLEGVSNWLQSVINSNIGRMQMKLEQDQCEHQATCEEIKPIERNPVNAIGFDYSDNKEEYYEEDC